MDNENRFDRLEDQLAELFLEEADPANWVKFEPDSGNDPAFEAKRKVAIASERYFNKKTASQTITILTKIVSYREMIRERATSGGLRLPGAESKLNENIKAAEVKEGVVKVETADKIRTLYETSLLPQAELSIDSALKNYQSGKVDLLTLLDTERVLKKTKIDYIGSLATYYKRIASLERVVGEELSEEKD